jgi:hypothetical protein
MSTEQAELKYYFGFRVINPVGSWVVQGPYNTNDQVPWLRVRGSKRRMRTSLHPS